MPDPMKGDEAELAPSQEVLDTAMEPPKRPEAPSSPRAWPWAVVVGLVAFAALAYGRASEEYFLDESNYLAQAYFFDLLAEGKRDDPAWLAVPALDQPPLFKALVGMALRIEGHRRSTPEAAMTWQRDYNLRPIKLEDLTTLRFGTPAMLAVARWPSLLLGVAGCVALFALGTVTFDRRVGVVAAVLLLANPLYRQEARRALNDVPCEALALASCAVTLRAWRRGLSGRRWPALSGAVAGGVLGGLAVLAKLTGLAVVLHVAAWTLLAALLPPRRPRSVGRAAIYAGAFGLAVMATLLIGNPTFTAHPAGPLDPEVQELARQGVAGRVLAMVRFRMRVSALQQGFYPHFALKTPVDKARIAIVQGFGRFSPFGPSRSNEPILLDWAQDRWAVVWLPWVLLGAIAAAMRGRRQVHAGEPPTAWAVLASCGVILACVVGYLPMAWDRYLMPLQPWNALLAAVAAVALLDGIARMVIRPSPAARAESSPPPLSAQTEDERIDLGPGPEQVANADD